MSGNAKSNIAGRSIFVAAVALVCVAVLIVRLFFLQVIGYDRYQAKVLDNITMETTITAKRGTIYDCNGSPLATNYTVYRVFISPRDIADDAQAQLISMRLSELLAVSYDTVYAETQKSRYADRTIKRNVEEAKANEVLAFINENDLDRQIHLEASSKRYYPYDSLAAQVIGLVGVDGGILGLELQYDDYLTGTDGKYVTAKDASGQVMRTKYESYVAAKDGNSIYTTIDIAIQSMLEEQLKRTYTESKAQNRVTGIVMDVETGAILAMATYPSFNLNDPYTLDADSRAKLDAMQLAEGSEEYQAAYNTLLYSLWKNKAISELYEPGSTFKIITTSMGIEEGAVTFDEQMTCPGYRVVAGQKIKCHKIYGHGTGTYAYGLQQSCNPMLMTVAERLGRATFYEYFKAYGYTEKTGIDLPGEAGSIYHTYSGMGPVELACYSFGQSFKVTPLQQLTAINAVANGGGLVTPYMVEKIVDADGNVVYSHNAQVKCQIVSEETASSISKVLEEGVSGNGGARNTYVAGYKIAAKTGTSQILDVKNEFGEDYLRVGSTVAYAPADAPQVSTIMVVDQPQCEQIYGSYVAAPYVANLLSGVLPYIGVQINYTGEDLKRINVTLRDYVGLSAAEAAQDLHNRGIEYTVEGDGEKVTYQTPLGGSTINKQTGKVTLYTGSTVAQKHVEVPNVVGNTAVQANLTIINRGLNIAYEGAANTTAKDAIVVSQTPEAGTTVPYGTVVTVTMRFVGVSDDTPSNTPTAGQ